MVQLPVPGVAASLGGGGGGMCTYMCTHVGEEGG